MPLQSILRRARAPRRDRASTRRSTSSYASAGSRDRAATPEQAREALGAFDHARELLPVGRRGWETPPAGLLAGGPHFLATAFFSACTTGEVHGLRVGDCRPLPRAQSRSSVAGTTRENRSRAREVAPGGEPCSCSTRSSRTLKPLVEGSELRTSSSSAAAHPAVRRARGRSEGGARASGRRQGAEESRG